MKAGREEWKGRLKGADKGRYLNSEPSPSLGAVTSAPESQQWPGQKQTHLSEMVKKKEEEEEIKAEMKHGPLGATW